jgi:hypothetical protein
MYQLSFTLFNLTINTLIRHLNEKYAYYSYEFHIEWTEKKKIIQTYADD